MGDKIKEADTSTKNLPLDVETTKEAFKMPGIVESCFTTDATLGRRVFYRVGFEQMALAIEADVFAKDDLIKNDNPLHAHYESIRKRIFRQMKKKNVESFEQQHINISAVVDIDDKAFEAQIQQDLAERFGEGNLFKYTLLMIIIINSITIGVQTDPTLALTKVYMFSVFDAIFLGAFIMEILLKWYYGFVLFWTSGWNLFNLILVIMAILGSSVKFFAESQALRVLRVLRAFRVFRSVTALRGLLIIMQTFIGTLEDMFTIIVLLVIVMFVFAIVGVTLFGTFDPVNFKDITSAMYSLFVMLSQDGWLDTYYNLVSLGQEVAASIFFTLFISIGSFVFLNIIVAVIVNGLQDAYEEIEKRKQQENRKLKTVSNKEDEDSGNSEKTKPVGTFVRAKLENSRRTLMSQIPFEIPSIHNISKTKLEDYILLLTLLEENMCEYIRMRDNVKKIYNEVRFLNKNLEKIKKESKEALKEEKEKEEFFNQMDNTDALTNIIAQNKLQRKRSSSIKLRG